VSLLGVYLCSTDTLSDWYYLAFPKDARSIKILVTVVYLIETAQTMLITSDCFNTYARNFGNPAALEFVENEWLAAPTMTAIGQYHEGRNKLDR
jgi:hypothetical protein